MRSLLNRQAAAITIRKRTTPIHGQPENRFVLPADCNTSPPPPVPGGGAEPGEAVGEGDPLTVPGGGDGLGERDIEPDGVGDARGVAFGLGDGLGFGVGAANLIVYVVHAGVEVTSASVPQTTYEPGAAPLGGAVGSDELLQFLPLVDGAGLVVQFLVLPKDQDTRP